MDRRIHHDQDIRNQDCSCWQLLRRLTIAAGPASARTRHHAAPRAGRLCSLTEPAVGSLALRPVLRQRSVCRDRRRALSRPRSGSAAGPFAACSRTTPRTTATATKLAGFKARVRAVRLACVWDGLGSDDDGKGPGEIRGLCFCHCGTPAAFHGAFAGLHFCASPELAHRRAQGVALKRIRRAQKPCANAGNDTEWPRRQTAIVKDRRCLRRGGGACAGVGRSQKRFRR